MHKNEKIRSNWQSVVTEEKESEIWGWSRWCEEGKIDMEVLKMLCTLFLKIDQKKTKKTKDRAILTYIDLQTKNMMNISLLVENHAR